MTLSVTIAPLPSTITEPPLSPADQRRLAAITHPRRRSQFLAGRALLAANGVAGLYQDDQGKPHSSDGRAISLSHSRQWLAAAVSSAPGAIGLDIEETRPGRALAPLLAKTLAVDDGQWQRAGSDQQQQLFYAGWVVREALAKADGRGLAWSLGAVTVAGGWLDHGLPLLTVTSPVAGCGWAWQLAEGLYLGCVQLLEPAPAAPTPCPMPPLPQLSGASTLSPRLLWQGHWRNSN